MISCHEISGISTPPNPQGGWILKKERVIVLIDSGSTHNFINHKLAVHLKYFIYPTHECQVMVIDEGTITCFGKCYNTNLVMEDYILNSPMYAISMGGVDIVLVVQWLTTLGTVEMNFQELFMRFQYEERNFQLRGLRA